MDRIQSGRSKAAIYVRVSTADQHVESQLYDLRELAEKRGFEISKEYQDCGVSGRRARRPGLDALISDAREKRFSVPEMSYEGMEVANGRDAGLAWESLVRGSLNSDIRAPRGKTLCDGTETEPIAGVRPQSAIPCRLARAQSR